MRILAVTHEASRSGAVTAFKEVLAGFAEIPVETVVVAKAGGVVVDDLRRLSASIRVTPMGWIWNLRRLARIPWLRWVPPHVERFVARRVVRAVVPDVVYCSTVLTSEYAAAAARFGVPTVLHVHEQEPLTSWALDRAGVRRASIPALCPSEVVRDELRALGMHVLDVVPGPVAEPLPARGAPTWPDDGFKVLACGSAAKTKGTAEWLEAANRLRQLDGRPVHWVWVGGGDLRGLEAQTTARGLDGIARWVGEQKEPAAWMAGADLVVIPSHAESLGLVAAEAAAVGTAAVAFDVGGLRTVLPHPASRVPPLDVDALVERTAELLRSDVLRREVLAASQQAAASMRADLWRVRVVSLVMTCADGPSKRGRDVHSYDVRSPSEQR